MPDTHSIAMGTLPIKVTILSHERIPRIELGTNDWKSLMLPLHHTRITSLIHYCQLRIGIISSGPKSDEWDSNPRPRRWQRRALPD
jgi:hypothetical protein